jgi:hypothetical protein
MPKQGLNCIYKGTEEYRKAIAKAFGVPKSYLGMPIRSKWRNVFVDEMNACQKDISELLNEENKMNKVYEGILVRVKDGEIHSEYTDNQDFVSYQIFVGANTQRARDKMVLAMSEEIETVVSEGFDWDIIVREFK